MFSGYLFSFVFILLLASGIFLFGYAARRVSALYVTALEIILGSLLVAPIVLIIDGINLAELFTKPSNQNWFWLGLASITGFIGGNFFSIINLKTAGERTNSLLSPAITACAVAASAIIFNEAMTLVKMVGIVITLTAVTFFLIFKTKNKIRSAQKNIAAWSGGATVLCITLTIICSIKGAQYSQLSIMHTVWLRLILVLPFAIGILLTGNRAIAANGSIKVHGAIAAGVIAQTILASYLWFYCTYKIGIATFQILIATLPFFVYAADVYLFKRTKPSLYFLITALVAVLGIWLVMS